MAMALLDAGIPGDRFQITGIDISERAVERARKGVYGKNSFRGGHLEFRERHFNSCAEGHQLNQEVRAQVDIVCGNILDANMGADESYDVIFCRNLLIYFDSPGRSRALGILCRLLRPKGLLFVGPSETGVPASHGFVSARIPHAFAFRKSGFTPQTKELAKSQSHGRAHKLVRPMPAPVPARPLRTSPFVKPLASTEQALQPAPSLDAARRLADHGLLAQAAEQCSAVMEISGPSAEALCLLGLLHDSQGRHGEAVASYRKAIYLDPDSRDALFHLGLLLERHGNGGEAKTVRDRLQRIERRRGA